MRFWEFLNTLHLVSSLPLNAKDNPFPISIHYGIYEQPFTNKLQLTIHVTDGMFLHERTTSVPKSVLL